MPTQNDYLAALIEIFGNDFVNPILDLNQLKKTSSISEFQFAFNRLLPQCNLSTNLAISCYFGGLKEELVNPLMMHDTQTLPKKYSLARSAEEIMATNNRSMRHGLSSGSIGIIKRTNF